MLIEFLVFSRIIDFTESNEKKLLEFGIFFPNGLTIKEHLKENDISFKCTSNIAVCAGEICDYYSFTKKLIVVDIETTQQ